MIHVFDAKSKACVAMIDKPDPKAIEPWLLIHKTGRIDRFKTRKAARMEARKSWANCVFRET